MTVFNLFSRKTGSGFVFIGGAATFLSWTVAGTALENAAARGLVVQSADEMKEPDAATAARLKALSVPKPGFLNAADAAAKTAANRASDAARKVFAPNAQSDPLEAAIGAAASSPRAPVRGVSFPGQNCYNPAGAIGPASYIQVNGCGAGLFNRTTGVSIASSSLNQLAGFTGALSSLYPVYSPRIIWDPTTDRFYYSVLYSFVDCMLCYRSYGIAFGYSKTSDPKNFGTDWCKYSSVLSYNSFGDGDRYSSLRLGDSQYFIIAGLNLLSANAYDPKSGLIAISKPAAGATCVDRSTFKVGRKTDLRDATGARILTPAPANQIDNYPVGFVVARNGATPSDKLWFFNVSRNPATGLPIFEPARGVTVDPYAIPPDATQPTYTQKIDTGDAHITQAVQSFDPRLRKQALWTQHTIANGPLSTVRWYEIDPFPAAPVVLRSGITSSPLSKASHFNAAISSDRRREGAQNGFGDSFVIEFNMSGADVNVSPRIVATSSVSGHPLSSIFVRNEVGPYIAFSCQTAGSTCAWSTMSGASPDPRPTVAGRGAVWGTNQFSGVISPPPSSSNLRTQIFELRP